MIIRFCQLKDFAQTYAIVVEPNEGAPFFICNPSRAPYDERVGYCLTQNPIADDFIIPPEQVEPVIFVNGVNTFFEFDGTLKQGADFTKCLQFFADNDKILAPSFVVQLQAAFNGKPFTLKLKPNKDPIVDTILDFIGASDQQ